MGLNSIASSNPLDPSKLHELEAVFVSNFYNHHQVSLSRTLYRILNKRFTFISTTPMDSERIALGYREINDPFLLQFQDNETECQQRINRADIVIIGSAPIKLVKERIKQGKLVFFYSERPLKKGIEPIKFIPRWLKWRVLNPTHKKAFLLCASAFAAADYKMFGMYLNRAYKWGYFPETSTYDIEDLISRKNKMKILWVGRFLEWKHPEEAIYLAKRLKDNGFTFTLDIIGTGLLEEKLIELSKSLEVSDCVNFLGAVSSDQVRGYMEEAGIYLFTSDRNEGWGAVLNESMNSACAVVASDAIGSVPYLINNNENGLIYHSGNIDELYERVKHLLVHSQEQTRLGITAYRTIVNIWNAELAAKRLVELSERLICGELNPDPFEFGPCSQAEIISDSWFSY